MKKGGHVEYFATEAAADYLGFPDRRSFERFINRQRSAGTLRIPVLVIGRRWRFRRGDLEQLAETLHEAQVGPVKSSTTRPSLKVVGGKR